MARSQRAWTRIAAWGGALAASAAVLLWLALFLDRDDKIARVASMTVGLAGLALSGWQLGLALRQPPDPLAPVDDAIRLDRAADALAGAVMVQWQAEAGRLVLRRPAPLRLRWSTTARPVAAPAQTVVSATITGRVVRLRLHGHVDEIAKKFLALQHRRLVVLGEPGAGKTVLVMLLTLELLARRQPGQPVPVLLSLSSWDPNAEHLDTWIARRLGETYRRLRGPTYGNGTPQRLVTSGRILPVLDGLDELPEKLRAAAISELDRARADRPLVVTCRSQEYEQAVTTGGGALAAAAVVELEPVTADEAIAFLQTAAAPAASRWDHVAAHLHAAPDGALAAALSTPLMVALARTIYKLPGCDPSELVDLAQAHGRAAVERHLLEGFIPAAYTSLPPAPDTPAPRLRRPPSPELARCWLIVLAGDLDRQHTRDLAWWQLHHAIPRLLFRLVFGLAVGLAAAGLVAGFLVLLAAGLVAGVAAGLVVGPVVGLLVGFLGVSKVPPARELRWSWTGRVVLWGFAGGLLFGLGGWSTLGPVGGLLLGLVGGFLFGPALGVKGGPADLMRAADPRTVLASDRGAFLAGGLISGLVFAGAGVLKFGLAFGFAGGFTFGLVVVLLGALHERAWGWFGVARCWLALRGRLPWRLMAFLDDAHRRGVLRQAGAVYQFRHARLQDHLADTSRRAHASHCDRR